ncbi:hypothetical protein U1Q18_048636 [Sarracenia purpurea var. burkii]
MSSQEVRIKIGEHLDHGFDAFRELTQAKWPEIDFDLIEPGGEVTPSASQRERAAEGQGIPEEEMDQFPSGGEASVVDLTTTDDACQPRGDRPVDSPGDEAIGDGDA